MATEILEAGAKAPAFSLETSTGKNISLSDFAGKQAVILYFYPRADTPGCTTETCGFRDALPKFEKTNAAVLGISPDSVEDVTKFGEKYDINFPLLADSDHAIAERYGVWTLKKNYGKEYMGIARTTFIIGKDGKIAHVFKNVKPEGHEKQVLEKLNELK